MSNEKGNISCPKDSDSDCEREKKKQRAENEQARRKAGGARLRSDNLTNHQESTTRNHADLNQDYVAISQLMKELDTQVGSFADNMNGMVESVPALDCLATLWEGLSRPTTKRTDTSVSRTEGEASGTNIQNHAEAQQEHEEELILGDEAEDQDDKLVFL